MEGKRNGNNLLDKLLAHEPGHIIRENDGFVIKREEEERGVPLLWERPSWIDWYLVDGIAVPGVDIEIEEDRDHYEVRIPAESVRKLSEIEVDMDDKAVMKAFPTNTRRPWYMVRGKSISREELKTILKLELRILRNPELIDEEVQPWEYRYLTESSLDCAIPRENVSIHASGWIRATGEIGANLCCGTKYPEPYEELPEWLSYALHYPFLDMVVGFTYYDELPCYFCPLKEIYEIRNRVFKNLTEEERKKPWQDWALSEEELKRLDQKYDHNDDYYRGLYEGSRAQLQEQLKDGQTYMPCRGELIPHCEPVFQVGAGRYGNMELDERTRSYEFFVNAPQVAEAIQVTLQIQNGVFRAYTGEEAKKVFLEYDRKYGFENTERYSSEWNSYSKEPIISEQLLRECLEDLGLDADRYIRFLVERERIELDYMQER